MNPFLMWLLQTLAQQQGGGGRRPSQPSRRPQGQPGLDPRNRGGGNPMDPTSGSRYSPQGFEGLQWFLRNYWNPGRTGQSTAPGGGNVFAGFTRGSNPNKNLNPFVGDTAAMRGGMPNPRESASESLRRNVGGPDMTSFDRWIGDIYAREGRTDLPDSSGRNWPFRGEAPRFGAGAGDVWRDFFSRGSSLERMDDALRGGGGGSGGGYMWLV